MAVKATTKKETQVASIGKLQFDILNNAKKVLDSFEKLPEIVNTVKEQVKEIESNFAYQLQEKEIENADARLKLDTELADYKTNIQNLKAELDAELDNKSKQNQRQLEELEYEHQIAVRDKKLHVAETIARGYKRVVVDSEEYNNLVQVKRLTDKEKTELEQATSTSVTERLTREHSNQVEKLESAHKLELLGVQKDNQALLKELAILRDTVAKHEKTIADLNRNIVEVSANSSKSTTVFQERK